jgi:uncharacterized protein
VRMSRTRALTTSSAVAVAALSLVGASTAMSSPAGAAPSSGVIVNEVYGGGGNTGRWDPPGR